jgi:hypothetical protein
MENTAYLANTTVRLEALVAKWERLITTLVTLFAVLAIAFGIVWLVLRKDPLLFTTLGFSSCYLIGRNFWKFRPQRISLGS